MSAPSISQSYVDQFFADARFIYQQKGSKIKPFVTVDPLAAQNGYFEYIQPINAVQRTGRAQEIVPANTEHTRRKCSQVTMEGSDYIDKFEQKILKIELHSAYAQNITMALGRALDQRITSAMIGTAFSGRAGTTPVPFDNVNQTISNTYVENGTGVSSNITTGKMRKAYSTLLGAEAVMDDDPANITVLYTANQTQSLLAICEAQKVQGVTSDMFKSGQPTVFMGMTWIRINAALLPKNGNLRSVLVFTRDAMNFCEVSDISLELNYIPQRKSWLITGDFQADAARMRENGVVQILCDETVV